LGKLRIEPKSKPPVTREEYGVYRKLLTEARNASNGNNVFYDLDKGEKPRKVRAAILYVASAEGIDVRVRVHRKQSCLSLAFPGSSSRSELPPSSRTRIPPAQARERIVRALKGRGSPTSKAEILAESKVSPTVWNLRVNELLDSGKIRRHGRGPNTSYSLRTE